MVIAARGFPVQNNTSDIRGQNSSGEPITIDRPLETLGEGSSCHHAQPEVSSHTPHGDGLSSQGPALAGVAAAAARSLQESSADGETFQAIMDEIVTLPVGTVTHVPRADRAILASVLADSFKAARSEGLWGFVRLMLLAKATLRSPPRGGRKKRYAVGASIVGRLKRWQQGNLMALWQEARVEGKNRGNSSGKEPTKIAGPSVGG